MEFREFVARRSPELLRTAWLLTGDWQLAEDLVQTALLQCLPRWASVVTPEAYVRTAILRTFLSWRRRPAADLALGDVDDRPAPGDAYDQAEVRAAVRSALALLSPRERAVVVLRYYVDLTEAGTAAALGLSTGAVKRYGSDGLRKLRAAPTLLDVSEPVSSSPREPTT